MQVCDVQLHSATLWMWSLHQTQLRLTWVANTRPGVSHQVFLSADAQTHVCTLLLGELPGNAVIEVQLHDRHDALLANASFRTAPTSLGERSIRFGWGGDVCGQGYGIHPDLGLPVFRILAQSELDFFILCGDSIYADHTMAAQRPHCRADGSTGVWPNMLANPLAAAASYPEQPDVAITADQFRSRYLYAWSDAAYRQFVGKTPMVYALDDHEIYNNWHKKTCLAGDTRYADRTEFAALAKCGLATWYEFAPSSSQRLRSIAPGFKTVQYGPMLDVFVLDARSQRSANSDNLQPTYHEPAYWLGPAQLQKLTQWLIASTALWKVVVSGVPWSTLVVDGDAPRRADGRPVWDGVANGEHGAPAGREIEVAMLLTALNDAGVENLVVLSGDVHFASAVHYDPQRAAFKDFSPFWEFVSGPLHSGGYPALAVDKTFGARQDFIYASAFPATAPGPGCTSFGVIDIDGSSGAFTASFRGEAGQLLYAKTLQPAVSPKAMLAAELPQSAGTCSCALA